MADEPAVDVGVSAPLMELVDAATGQPRPLYVAGRRTLINFLRGTWCDDCVAFLGRLKALHPTLQQNQIDLVAIVCQARHWAESWLKTNALPFPILVDASRAAAKAYDVYKLLGFDGFNLARPSSFLVNPAGSVVWRYVGSSSADRPGDELLRQVLEKAR